MKIARPLAGFQQIPRLAELGDYTVAFILRAACTLGVFDHLAAEPRTIDELAAATGTHARSLLRALRVLATAGIVAEPAAGRFALTPTGQLLRADHPLSMRDACRLVPADVQAWAALDRGVRTGEPAFELVHGQTYAERLAADAGESAAFQRSQHVSTRLEVLTLFRAFDWRSLRTVVDVGGGDGTFLAQVLARHQDMRGVLVDLPQVVAAAAGVLAAAGVAERCEVRGADFFGSAALPAGADGYVLKRVLYGWDDGRAARLLRAVRGAMRADSRLLVIEPLMGDGDEVAATTDLLMLALGPGRVRTAAELERLLARAGLELTDVVTTRVFPVAVARPGGRQRLMAT